VVERYDTRTVLKDYIDNNGIKMTFIAERTGITKDRLSRIFQKERRLTADEFLAITEVLKVDVNELMKREEV
jgi:transcriptional regulator with XRE-family HTH domain